MNVSALVVADVYVKTGLGLYGPVPSNWYSHVEPTVSVLTTSVDV